MPSVKTNVLILSFATLCILQGIMAQQQISFGQLTIKDGLSQNCGISVAQDSTGYLWIATQDGLNRYDGNSFTTYPYIFADITRPDYSELGKVYVDRQNQVWCIPASRKLIRLDKATNSFQTIDAIADVSVLFQDNNFGYWIGTHSNGLYHAKPGEAVSEVQRLGTTKATIFDLKQHGSEILAASDQGVVVTGITGDEPGNTINSTANGEKIKAYFSAIAVDQNGRQWFGTYGGGIFYRDGRQSFLNRTSALPLTASLPDDLNILSLYVDSKNRLWIGTYGQGLFLVDLNSWAVRHFMADKYNPKAIHYNDILSIYEDYTGTIWFGTDGAGLSFYDEYLEKFNAITNFQVPQNINVEVIRALTTDRDGAVWLGTSGKGLMKYSPASNNWEKYTTTNSALPSNRIMSLLTDGEGELWIGTQGGGLAIRDTLGNIKNFLEDPGLGLSAVTIWDIHQDGNNQFWLATRENGLIQFDKALGQLQAFNRDNSNGGLAVTNNIRVIAEDSRNNLWLGTDSEGLIYLDLEKSTTTLYAAGADNNTLNSNMIKTLYFSGDDNILWIGTYGGGLNALSLEENRFYHYTEDDGLANNVIYAILPDKQGNLWLSSNRGITRFTPGSDLEAAPTITNYTNYEGLATEFNTGAYHMDEEGQLYFGGLEGYYWFNPASIKENDKLPKTAITGLLVDNQLHQMHQGLRLNHNQNTLSFSFSSMQFSLPEKNQYQYRLSGLEEEWVPSGNTNFARYSNLPPGDYEFQVVSSNYDGVWNLKPATYAFTIAPPWYLSNLAKGAYVLLLFLAAYFVYRYFKWRWRIKLELQLKEEETRRLQKLDDLKSKLYTDISHEIRTPLTLISGPIDAKLNDGTLSDADRSGFSMIKRNTNRLMALTDQMLHLARLEKGNLKLRVRRGNLGQFLGMLATSFRYKADEKAIDYQIGIEGIDTAWYDEDALEKIVTNLLNNAFKYCPPGGAVSFDAEGTDKGVIIAVRNTVQGLAEEDLEQLFNRFYQKDEFSEGIGVGLSLVKQLVTLYEGEVRVVMEEDDLIHFSLQLPISFEGWDPEKIVLDHQEITEEPAPETGTITTASDTGLNNRPNHPIVLLVEDHPEVREFLVTAWKDKYRVLEAENGEAGMEKALKTIPDLIISDIRMPLMNGIELCNRLKTDERTSHIPVILLTAGAGDEAELQGLESGADDFVTKPFKLPLLEKRVQNLIEGRRALRSRYSQEVILKARDIAITPTDEAFLNKVQSILDQELADPSFNASKFAKAVNMSRMQLHRKLTAITGLSTTEFIRSQRLKQAAHILKTSDITINEVAYSVGFNTPSYFIKCFKKAFGKTPVEFLETTD